MVVGILQFELLIHEAESLKDKRRVVLSVKDRLHREHQASVAEVDAHDLLNRAVLGLAVVGREGRRVGEVLDQITAKLRGLHGAELGDVHREILHGAGSGGDGRDGRDGPDADEGAAGSEPSEKMASEIELERTLNQEMIERARGAEADLCRESPGTNQAKRDHTR